MHGQLVIALRPLQLGHITALVDAEQQLPAADPLIVPDRDLLHPARNLRADPNIIGLALASNWSRNWWKEFGPTAFTEPFVNMVNKVLDSADVDYAEIVEKIDKQKGHMTPNDSLLFPAEHHR